MNIYFNGDSNTIGTELSFPETEAFPYVLSNLLNASFQNDALAGASNSRILRTTDQYLYKCKSAQEFPDLIILGWSSMEREDWYYNSDYRSLNSFSLNMDDVLTHSPDRYNYWKENVKHNTQRRAMSRYFNNAIYNLHCELLDLKIPHLFFNALTSFSYDFNTNEDDTVYEFNWGKNFIDPYNQNACMVEWAKSNGYLPTEWLHFNKDAHTDFANLLFNYIMDNDILNP